MPRRKKPSTVGSGKIPNKSSTNPRWDDFRFVEAVARFGSLNQAAIELEVDQTTVNYRISRLEQATGRPLFTRSPRGAVPTVAGRRMADAVLEAELIFQRAMDVARSSGIGTREVKIAAPDGLATLWIGRFLPWFMTKFERVAMTIAPFDPMHEEKTDRYDSQLQFLKPNTSRATSRKIATLHYLPYASAEYVRRFGRPKTKQELLKHRVLDLSAYVLSIGDWEKWVGDAKIRQNRVLTTDFTGTFVSAIRGGMGIGLLPTYLSAVYPDIVALDVGIEIEGLPVWHAHPDAMPGRVNPAVALIDHAFDPKKMPWFAEQPVPPKDFFQIARALQIPL